MSRLSRIFAPSLLGFVVCVAGCHEEKAEVSEKPVASAAPAPAERKEETAPEALVPFEGVVRFFIDDGGGAAPKKFAAHLQEKRVRLDLPEPAGAFAVIDLETKKMLSVIPEEKLATEMDFGALRGQVEAFFPQTKPKETTTEKEEPFSLEKTAREATIAGEKCRIWEGTSKEGATYELCLATIGTNWFSLASNELALVPSFARELFDGRHLPLRVVHTEQGKKPVKIEIEALERKKLEETLFALPEGYRRVDMTKTLGALGALADQARGASLSAKALDGQIPPELRKQIEELQKKKSAEATKATQPAPFAKEK